MDHVNNPDAKDDALPASSPRAERRAFLKKAGIIAVAAPVMESLSKEGLLVRSAHAQTAQFDGFGGLNSGPIGDPT